MAESKNKKSPTEKKKNEGKSGASKDASKKGSEAKTGGTSKKKQEKPEKKNPAGSRMRDEIIAIVLVALGIFLILSIMTSATGEFGAIFSMLLKGCFGLAAYILPFYIIAYALLVLMNRMAHINSRTVFFTFLMYLDITMLNSARFTEVKAAAFTVDYIKQMFAAGAVLDSAGAVGMILGWLSVKCVDIAGMWIIGIVVILISVMMIANTPFSVFFDRRREKKNRKLAEMSMSDNKEQNDEMSGAVNVEVKTQRRNNKDFGMPKASEMKELPEKNSEAEVYETVNPTIKNQNHGDSAFENLKIKGASLFKSRNSNAGDELYMAQRYQEEALLPDNKRQILQYMNDEEQLGSQYPYWQDSYENSDLYEDSASESDKKWSEDMAVTDFSDLEDFQENKDFYSMNFQSQSVEETDAGADTVEGSSEFYTDSDKENLTENIEENKKLSKSEVRMAVTQGAAQVSAEIQKKENEKKVYKLPPLSLLNKVKRKADVNEASELHARAAKLEQVLHDFGVNATVIDVKKGPAVTRYEIQPATGVKVNSIVRLADDIALNLEAKSLRIEAPIPGKAAVGIEVENESSDVVTLREMVESTAFKEAKSKISFVVGEDIAGNSVVADLKGMPHLLIAGSTGSGKSVCINSIIMSMIYKSTPDEVKFILIDPKVVELGNYNGIPHMLIPVVTDPAKAAAALAWAVQEMNDRYKKFAEHSVRDLKAYNDKMKKEGETDNVLPQIVIIIDELADLMMAAAKQVEESICRLAQLARAAGMHLVVATQRPSVDVVTGLIKANIPSRIAFAVSSQVDSRTILDRVGAEKLVGKGDMLFYPLGKAQPERLQGPFVTDDEVTAVIDFWKEQSDESNTSSQIMDAINTVRTEYVDNDDEDEDELLKDAVDLVLSAGHASASMLQRRFRIGYNRAGRLIDIMEARGIIGPSEGSKPRRVLITKEEYENPEIQEVQGNYEESELHTADYIDDGSVQNYSDDSMYTSEDEEVNHNENIY